MKMKRNMKRIQKTLSLILALALTLSLAFALSACAPKDDGGDTTPTPVSEAPETPPEEALPEETTPDTVTPEEENDDETPADNSEARGAIQSGAWNGDVFTNEWVNISFTLPDGWRALTEDEIRAQMELGLSAAGGDASQALQEAAMARTANDFVIAGALGVPSITATYENISYSPLTANLNADEYFEAMKLQLSGMGFDFGDTSEVQIAGETYYLCEASLAVMEGVNMYQRFYLRKLDGAIVMFAATFMSENLAEVDDFFASIAPAK
jgi:hypothetical protein